ncbi:transposase, partial [Microcoleus sp.]|uniref:transposase n=1 Tax=Microcoleus sp. TaxID=44472 RepID=UPI003526AEE8
DCANRYFLSFVVEINSDIVEAKNHSIGIDLGIKTFAVMSDGRAAKSPSYKQLDRKIRRLQRKLARQPKDSKRRNKTRIQILIPITCQKRRSTPHSKRRVVTHS